jgi:predicted nuclease of restriction endonuclease-like (RecB) superfamily
MTRVNRNSDFDQHFSKIAELITNARKKVLQSVNSYLIELYWKVGEYVSKQVTTDGWGKGTIEALATYIHKEHPLIKGFNSRNLWRMKQFYDAYFQNEKLSSLLTELTWTNNLLILSKTKTIEEKEFYLRLTIKERYSSRELERQIDSSLFERQVLSKSNLISNTAKEKYPKIDSIFRDSYVVDFLGLSDQHSESEFRKKIVSNLKIFILEFGRDFYICW